MRTGTGGLKDGSGNVLIVCNSDSEADDTLRTYRAVDQDPLRFDAITSLEDANVALIAYGPGTKWCIPSDAPAWFSEGVRVAFNKTFGAQSHTSQAFATYTDEYAINPKLLEKPST